MRQTGRPAESRAEFERAIATLQKLVEANPDVIRFQSRLALNFGYVGGLDLEAGRHALAAAAIRRSVAILERLPNLEPVDRYNLACAHAQLAGIAAEPGSGMTAAEGRAQADLAMHWLRQAVAAGYRDVALMRSDTDIRPLRSHPDFQLLMMDLEFPADPFSR